MASFSNAAVFCSALAKEVHWTMMEVAAFNNARVFSTAIALSDGF